MIKILKKVTNKTKKLDVGFYKMTLVCISESLFADDTDPIAKTKQGLEQNISICKEETHKIGININKGKTEIINIGEATINNEQIEEVKEFKYLGIKKTLSKR